MPGLGWVWFDWVGQAGLSFVFVLAARGVIVLHTSMYEILRLRMGYNAHSSLSDPSLRYTPPTSPSFG
jgi:hypothetical protein